MTTIAMIGGMLPSALRRRLRRRVPLADGDRRDRRPDRPRPLLSLVFVPAVFAVMDDIAKLGWRIFARFVGRARRPSRRQRWRHPYTRPFPPSDASLCRLSRQGRLAIIPAVAGVRPLLSQFLVEAEAAARF